MADAVTLNVPEVFFVVGFGVEVGRAIGLGVAVVLVSVLSSLTAAVAVVS